MKDEYDILKTEHGPRLKSTNRKLFMLNIDKIIEWFKLRKPVVRVSHHLDKDTEET